MRLPYTKVEFESTGVLHDEAQRRAAIDLVAKPGITEVLMLAHGWNNDMRAARQLFEQLGDNVVVVQQGVPTWRARKLAVVGVLWPSVRWADRDDLAGGGAGAGDELTSLLDAIGDSIENPDVQRRLRELAPQLDRSAQARREFLDLLREVLPDTDDDEDAPPPALVSGDAERAFDEARGTGLAFGTSDRAGGAASVGAAPADIGGAARVDFGSVLRGARNLLNLTSYYTMKERGGTVGRRGVAPLVADLSTANPAAHIHLAGHSFGARVMAATASASQRPIHSLTLLQGAFSHHGFAQRFDGRRDGAFRGVLTGGRLKGPLLVTHTANDRAVGLAYAIASRLARQAGAAVGAADDRYGGIGRNGALKTPEVAARPGTLLKVGDAYMFRPGEVYNLRSDDFIHNHGDVTNRQVAYALLAAMFPPAP